MNVLNNIKKFWKGITCGVVLLAVTGGFLAYAIASDSTTVSIVLPAELDANNLQDQQIYSMQANVTNVDAPATIIDANLHWVSADANIVTFWQPDMSSTSPSVTGRDVKFQAVAAGQTEVKAVYYYYPNYPSRVVNLSDVNPPESYKTVESRAVSLKCNLVVENVEPMIMDGRVYDGISSVFQTNTNQVIDPNGNVLGDPILIRTSVNLSDKYVKVTRLSPSQAKVDVTGGGMYNIIVSTEKGYQGNNQYFPGLSKAYQIYNKVHFDDSRIADGKLLVTEEMYNSSDLLVLGSNVAPNSNVTAKSSNANVATFDPDSGRLALNGAGHATLTAGILNADGSWMKYTDALTMVTTQSQDSVDVVIPLMIRDADGKYRKEVTVKMGVGDRYAMLLNVPDNATLTYPIHNVNTDVVNVSNGSVLALSAGTTDVIARYNLGAGYEAESEVVFHIEVGDNFTLSNTTHEMNIGETYDLQVFSSSNEPITYTVNGTVIENGKSPTGMKCEVDGANKKIIHLTAEKAGEYQVIATQTQGGVVRSATAVVKVRSGVTKIRINPDKVSIGIKNSATLYAIVEPADAYNKDIVWVSSDESKATVEKTSAYEANVTGVSGGIVTIFAVSATNGEIQGSCTVTVTKSAEGITLNTNSLTVDMTVNPTYQLTATVYPANTPGANDGIDRSVEWTSSNEKILKVDQNGLVTFVSQGSATVVAKSKSAAHIATCDFTVVQPVQSVNITSNNITDMIVGQSISLTAEVLPLTASNRMVKWTSTDTNVCTIDTNGKMTAKGPGDTVIWCNSVLNGNVSDYILVHVIEPVSGIVLNLKETTVRKGTEFWLFATVYPTTAEYKDVVWQSSDESIAKVDQFGKVTTIAPGTATITALNDDSGKNSSCVVNVTESVLGIILKTGDSETVIVGHKYTIIPVIEPIDAADKSVTYFSSDTSIATVDAKGVVTGVKGGECDIVVTTNDRELSTKCHITVIEFVDAITLDKTFEFVNIGKTKQLIASISNSSASDKTIMWKSADTSIATVDANGVITGRKIGTTIITAYAKDRQDSSAVATCVVQVVEPVTAIKLGDSTLNLYKGDTKRINVSVEPSTATVKALKWESNAPSIATVDEDGEITAVGPGKARITATSTDGNNVSATILVYVTDTVNANTIILTPSSLNMKTGEVRSINVRTLPTTITESIGWISSNPTVATVDANGRVTAVGEGEADITAFGRASGIQSICKVVVDNPVNKATSIRLNTNEMILLTGQTRPIQYRLLPTNSVERINWISSDFAVATVNSDGVVTTVGPGQCTIIAQTSLGGIETTCTVYSMALSKTSMTLQQYDPFTLYVDGAPDNAKISWRTGNARIATVSASGEVIGRKEGTTTITATIEDKTLTCIVKIVSATKN